MVRTYCKEIKKKLKICFYHFTWAKDYLKTDFFVCIYTYIYMNTRVYIHIMCMLYICILYIYIHINYFNEMSGCLNEIFDIKHKRHSKIVCICMCIYIYIYLCICTYMLI